MMVKKYSNYGLGVGLILFRLYDNKLQILLSRDKYGKYVVPSVQCKPGYSLMRNLVMMVSDSFSPDVIKSIKYIEQLYTYCDGGNSGPTLIYVACANYNDTSQYTTDDNWVDFNDLESKYAEIFADNFAVIEYAMKHLDERARRSNIVINLLNEEFTLSELNYAYDAVMNRNLDKRNFRKKALSLGFIEDTGKVARVGAHRPAKVYRAKHNEYFALDVPFC